MRSHLDPSSVTRPQSLSASLDRRSAWRSTIDIKFRLSARDDRGEVRRAVLLRLRQGPDAAEIAFPFTGTKNPMAPSDSIVAEPGAVPGLVGATSLID